MGTGPLRSPVALQIRDGDLVGVEGDEAGRLQSMLDRCADPRMGNLAEVSVAFNPNGRVCGVAMGVPILDNCDLEKLSQEANARRRWAFLLTVGPLAVEGGTGSPVNPLATF